MKYQNGLSLTTGEYLTPLAFLALLASTVFHMHGLRLNKIQVELTGGIQLCRKLSHMGDAQ